MQRLLSAALIYEGKGVGGSGQDASTRMSICQGFEIDSALLVGALANAISLPSHGVCSAASVSAFSRQVKDTRCPVAFIAHFLTVGMFGICRKDVGPIQVGVG